PAHRHRHRRHHRGRLSLQLAVHRRRHPQLRKAERGARHVARVALPLADPHLLVRRALGRAVRAVRHRHARHRHLHRVDSARRRRPLVHLPHRHRLAPSAGSPGYVLGGPRNGPPHPPTFRAARPRRGAPFPHPPPPPGAPPPRRSPDSPLPPPPAPPQRRLPSP